MLQRLTYSRLTIITIVLFGFAYTIAQSFYMGVRPPISPDELQALFFSKNLAENHSLVVHSLQNSEFSQQIFASRQFVQRGIETAPSAFLGYIFILALFQAIHPSFLFLVGPLLATLTLYFVFRIAYRLFDEKIAFYSILILGTFPVFVYWTLSYYNNLAETCFVLGVILFLLRALSGTGKAYDYALVALLSSAAIWVRYTNVLLLVPPILVFAFLKREYLNYKYLAISFMLLILTLMPLIVLNNALYGSPLKFGQGTSDQLVYSIEDPNIPKEAIPYVPFRSFDILITNFNSYLNSYVPLISALGLLGAFAAYKNIKFIRKEIMLLATLCSGWILYYMGGVYFGYGGQPLLSSSYTRYLLIVYIVLIIFLSYLAVRIFDAKLRAFMILSIIIISTVMTVQGVTSLKKQARSYADFSARVQLVTPAKSVIFVKGADKVLYPERNTALYLTLSKNEDFPGQGVQQTVALMKENLEKGYNVYIFKEDEFYVGEPVSVYLNEAKRQGLSTDKYNTELGFYEITR